MTDEWFAGAVATTTVTRGCGRPATPAPGADEVHVWRVHLDAAGEFLEQLTGTLSTDERRRASGFLFPRDRRWFVARRGALRLLLGGYLDRPPGTVTFGYAESGKPELAAANRSAITFNCSHSQGLAVYAFARGRRVGIDVEAVRHLPEAEGIAQRCFSARERSELAALPPHRFEEAVIRGWTRKEAYTKAVGEGLARPLEGVEVSLEAGARPALRSIDGNPAAAASWSLRAWSPGSGYVAALVVEGPRCRLQRMPRVSPAAPGRRDGAPSPGGEPSIAIGSERR